MGSDGVLAPCFLPLAIHVVGRHDDDVRIAIALELSASASVGRV